MMALGGHGTANMTGNIIPAEMAVISTPWVTGDDAFACRDGWLTNLPMLHFAYSAINPGCGEKPDAGRRPAGGAVAGAAAAA